MLRFADSMKPDMLDVRSTQNTRSISDSTLIAGLRSLHRDQPTSCHRRSRFGGDKGDRTPDLVNAIHALSQLSYIPGVVGFLPVAREPVKSRPRTRASA